MKVESSKDASRVVKFIRLLDEMYDRNEAERSISGEVIGPIFSSAVYGMVVRLGIEGAAGRRLAGRRRK